MLALSNSSLFKFFKENGFIVSSIQTDFNEQNLIELNDNEQTINKELLLKHFGKEKHLKNIENLLAI